MKERQRALAYAPKDKTSANPLLDRRRPKHLLAGLAKCGVCGGGYTLISEHLLGCATRAEQGHLRQPAQHPARRARGVGAERA